jgi:hypothetical protein
VGSFDQLLKNYQADSMTVVLNCVIFKCNDVLRKFLVSQSSVLSFNYILLFYILFAFCKIVNEDVKQFFLHIVMKVALF